MARRQTLDDTEKAVLEFVELRGNATVPEIARAIRIKGPRARRILDSLLERKLLYRYVHLNVYPLGYFEVNILVTFRNNSRLMCERVVKWCIQHPKVCILTETGGTHNLEIGLTVKSMLEVSHFMEAICQEFNFPFLRKEVLIINELIDFGVNKGATDLGSRTFRFGFSKDSYELFKHDAEILKLLSLEPHIPPFGMAKKLGIPASTLAYRLEKLEKAGVIAGYRYLFDPLGKTVDYFRAKVSLGGVTPSVRRTIHNFCGFHPKISFFAEVQGDADYLVCIAANRAADAIEVVRSLEEALAPIAAQVEVYSSPTLRKLSKYPFD